MPSSKHKDSPGISSNLRSKTITKTSSDSNDIIQTLQKLQLSITSMNSKLESIQLSVSEQKNEFIELRKYFNELSGTVSTLKSNFNSLEKEVTILRKQINLFPKNEPLLPYNAIQEAQMRIKKSRNILIFNVPECKTSPDDTKTIVTNILNDIVPNVPVIKTKRLASSSNKPRPILLELENNDTVRLILKAKSKLRQSNSWNSVWITSDQTMMQRNQLKLIKSQLQDKINAGDRNWFIKYVHGEPTLTQKNVQLAQI